MRSKLTPRGKERRAQLIECAADLFAQRGYHQTSVADVVERLGVGKGVFYWYFSSKEELLAEILRASSHDLRRRQQAAIVDIVDPMERIEVGIRTSMQWFHEHRKYFALFQSAANIEPFASVARRNGDVAVADAVRHIKDGIVEGLIPDQDPEMLAEAVIGVIEKLTRVYIFDRDESPERAADATVAFCLHGLLGQPVTRAS